MISWNNVAVTMRVAPTSCRASVWLRHEQSGNRIDEPPRSLDRQVGILDGYPERRPVGIVGKRLEILARISHTGE